MIHPRSPLAKQRYDGAMRSALAVVVSLTALACTPTPSSEDEGSSTGGEAETWEVAFAADESLGALMSVWGPSPDEVYAVGGQPMPSVGVVLRLDGEDWVQDDVPAGAAMLNWVYGVDGEVWAVGQEGTIIHRAGGSWAAEPSPTDRVLWGVWGASSDELWAVGGDGFSDAPLLLRRDGASASWEEVALPELGVEAKGLFKVWGWAADDVWIVGDLGATLHYDGGEWTGHPTDGAVDLISLWGTEAEGLVAVGGRSSGRVARLEGTTWTEEVLVEPGLNGVWVDPAGPITAVGVQGRILSITPGGFDYTLEDSPTSMLLHSVFGFGAGPRYAVGGSLLMSPPHVGVILRAPPG
jgi:hypothetical protein